MIWSDEDVCTNFGDVNGLVAPAQGTAEGGMSPSFASSSPCFPYIMPGFSLVYLLFPSSFVIAGHHETPLSLRIMLRVAQRVYREYQRALFDPTGVVIPGMEAVSIHAPHMQRDSV